MASATGTFDVLGGGDDPLAELEGGSKLTHASGTQRFSGDIEGDGAVDWLMLYRSDKTAHFVGLQRITGSVGGRRGSFVLAAEGDHDGSASTITLNVVAEAGTGDLAGIRGSGRMVAPGKTGTYELQYELDA
jgi:hypothetical protein